MKPVFDEVWGLVQQGRVAGDLETVFDRSGFDDLVTAATALAMKRGILS